jgi:hypothetical protein
MLSLGKSICTNLCYSCYLKRLVREKLNLILLVGLVAFDLAFGGWRVEWFLTLHLSLFFSRSYLGVFENFAKKDKDPRMVPSIAQVVFVTSPKALSQPQLPTLWLVCGALGRISMRLTFATWCCWAKDPIQEETSHATWSIVIPMRKIEFFVTCQKFSLFEFFFSIWSKKKEKKDKNCIL